MTKHLQPIRPANLVFAALVLPICVVLPGCGGNSSDAAGALSTVPTGTQSRNSYQRAVPPHAAQVTIVVMENKDYDRIVGNPNAPYINQQLIPNGVLLSDSHAVGHPSEPNYLALFSGSTHDVHGDPCPLTYSTNNVAAELIAAGKTFAGYSESMPSDGYTGCETDKYARKHSPWVDFTNVPVADNLVYHGFPSSPPTLAWITPNLCNDMHDCTIAHGDKWLSKHVPAILAWDAAHDGLLIVTFDEAAPDLDKTNHIATVLLGPMVEHGKRNTQTLSHYAILHTVESAFGLACIKDDCAAPLITGVWKKT